MSRKFTLRALLAVVTVVCLLCALAVNFPLVALIVVLVIGCYAPTFVICVGLAWLSSRPVLTLNAALLGAIVAFWIVPPIHVVSGHEQEFWNLYSIQLETKALPAAFGALLAGMACAGVFPRWKKPRPVDGE
jgi:hypothetical protein